MKFTKTIASLAIALSLLTSIVGCSAGEKNQTADDQKQQVSTQTASTQTASTQPEEKKIKIGVSFDSLQSQFWLANYDAIKTEIASQNAEMVEAIADGDTNKQLQQIENLIALKVDAIICVPKDNKAILTAIKEANDAGIPFITDNRSADEGADVALDVGADSYAMAKKEAQWLVDNAKKKNIQYKALVLVGDLKDVNAVKRDQAFEEVSKANPGVLDIVAKNPTEWKAEIALSGTVNALQANKDINCIFMPSDSLLPSVISALQQQNRYFKSDDPNHVTLASFDGAKEGLDAIKDKYSDIDLVQDAVLEGQLCVQGAIKLAKGEKLDSDKVYEPGFEVTQENFDESTLKAWAYMNK
jgi:ABC-type sugar transport system substrate-binding protein